MRRFLESLTSGTDYFRGESGNLTAWVALFFPAGSKEISSVK